MRRGLLILMSALVLAGAACSSSDNGGGATTGGATTGGATTGGATTGGATTGGTTACANPTDLTGDSFKVTIQNFAFHPDCFTATASATFTVNNKDTTTHTFTVKGTDVDITVSNGSSAHGDLSGVTPGTYDFFCKIHPTMIGQMIVA
jgi:plastocyanin